MTETPDRGIPGGVAHNGPVADLLPEGYAELLARVKNDVLATRLRAMRTANTELIALYWRIGTLILDRQQEQGWGTRVIDRLAADLRRELGEQRGWSRSNLFSMRALAAAWPDPTIAQQAVGRLPWGQVTVLLKLDDPADRDWYADRPRWVGGRDGFWNTTLPPSCGRGPARRPITSRPNWTRRTPIRPARYSGIRTCSTSSG